MRPRKFNAIRVSSSNFNDRLAELRANHESEELRQLLERGYKPKRARIVRKPEPKFIVTIVFGSEVRVTIKDFNEHYQGFKVVREIY